MWLTSLILTFWEIPPSSSSLRVLFLMGKAIKMAINSLFNWSRTENESRNPKLDSQPIWPKLNHGAFPA